MEARKVLVQNSKYSIIDEEEEEEDVNKVEEVTMKKEKKKERKIRTSTKDDYNDDETEVKHSRVRPRRVWEENEEEIEEKQKVN